MELLNTNNIYVPTVDDNGEVTWGEITAITRHDPGDKLYEIKTSGGRSVIVTESKSLLVWNENKNQFLEMLTPDIFLRSIELVLNPSKKYLMPYTQVTLLTFDNSFTFKRGLNSDIYRIYISSNDETNFRTAVSYVEIVLTNNINVDYGHNISYQKE